MISTRIVLVFGFIASLGSFACGATPDGGGAEAEVRAEGVAPASAGVWCECVRTITVNGSISTIKTTVEIPAGDSCQSLSEGGGGGDPYEADITQCDEMVRATSNL